MTQVERVYIGGFDASRLSGAEIVSRLKSQLSETIEIQDDVHMGSCFCHVNVLPKKEGTSGLECIVKLYHNVKWKGCKLKVEKARPHLLDRLEAERQERRTNKGAPHLVEENVVDDAEKTLPRFLKIKQRHGQECWKVDTRPLEVTDWKRFEKLRTKMTAKPKPPKTKPTNRVTVAATTNRKSKPAIHVTFAPDVAVATTMLVEADANGGSCTSSTTDSSVADAPTGVYEWSDDENSTSDNSSVARKALSQNKPFKEASVLDEFVPALDASSHVSDDSDEILSTTRGSELDEHEWAAEVEKGLNVLSELFPDVNKTVHMLSKESGANDSIPQGGAGASATVLMERYDPTDASAEKYLLTTSVDQTSSNPPVALPLYDETKPMDVSTTNAMSDVYEEKRLEAVFRSVRDVAVPTVAPANETNDESGTFLFGFHVDSAVGGQSQQTTKNSTFDVSLNAKDIAAEAVSEVPLSGSDHDGKCAETNDSPEHDSQSKRRRTFFTRAELSSYVEDFFLMGDGEKIRDDLDRYRGDEEIHERWMQERKVLTQDWKRKQKNALSRPKHR